MTNKTKIMFIISSLSSGGAEMMLCKIIENLDKKKYEIFVLSLTSENELSYVLNKNKIKFKILDFRSSFMILRILFILIKEIKNFSPDIVHTWMYHSDLLGGIAAKFVGTKKIIWNVRACEMDLDKVKFSTIIVRRICSFFSNRIPNLILFNSKSAIKSHLKLGYKNPKIKFIPNGFDTKKFVPSEKIRKNFKLQHGINKNTFLIGMVSRDDPLKNNEGALKVITFLKAENYNIKLVVIGKHMDGNNIKFKNRIIKYNLNNDVILQGFKKNIERIIPAFDCLIIPSHAEAFPNVLGEAMSCEIPCVVTDVGDCKSIVSNIGMVVKKNDMSNMAKEIKKYFDSTKIMKNKIKKRARKIIVKKYNIEKIVKMFEIHYKI